MTERDKSNKLREKEIKRIKKYYEDQGFMVERILSQNSPSSIILFTEDEDNVERYIEVKFIVKKPEYEPDEDMENFKVEMQNRAVKKVRAEINKLNKKDRVAAEQQADKRVKELVAKYLNGEEEVQPLLFFAHFSFPKIFLAFSQKKTLVEQTLKPSLIVFDPTSYNKLSSPSEREASAQ